VFIEHDILMETSDSFFLADDWGVSGAQSNGNSQEILSFGKDSVFTNFPCCP
jgi:hypothetical protein